MRWHSMRPVERAVLQMFEEGEVTIKAESGRTFRYVFEEGERIRIPQAELRRHFGSVANKYDANDGDIRKVMKDLFGESVSSADGEEFTTVNKGRGNVECEEFDMHLKDDGWLPLTRKGTRFFEFPPVDVLRWAMSEKYGRGTD